MAEIVDYSQVLARMTAMGLECVYYNSGSFGLGRGEDAAIVGWLSGPDATIRPELGATIVHVPSPGEANLASWLVKAWTNHLTGPAWVVPKSHWSFELDHGHGDWLRPALAAAGIDADVLAPLTNAAAIAFDRGENAGFEAFIRILLEHLTSSDFAVLFPEHRLLATLHHHKQIWWQTADADLSTKLAKR